MTNNVEPMYDDNGQLVGHLVNKDTKYPESYRYVRDDDGDIVGVIYAEDPKRPQSWRNVFNDAGEVVGRIYAEDPEHPRSWRDVFNGDGRLVGQIYAEDPKHPMSWGDPTPDQPPSAGGQMKYLIAYRHRNSKFDPPPLYWMAESADDINHAIEQFYSESTHEDCHIVSIREMPVVVITVRGGVVESVEGNVPHLKVVLNDHDELRENGEDPEIPDTPLSFYKY